MKIALYKGVQFNTEIILQCIHDDDDTDEYIRISEVMEVDFIMLQNDKVSAKEIAILEKEKTDIQAETQLKINELDRRIGELLA